MREDPVEIEFGGPDSISVQLRKHGIVAPLRSVEQWERTDQAIDGMFLAGIISEEYVWSARRALVAEMQKEVVYK